MDYSHFYISEPFGFKDQPIFINLSVLIDTVLSPFEIFKINKKIEREMGRVKEFKNSPRIIDIDILLYENLVLITKKLKIPHKEFLKRPFTFFPSLEIAPNFVYTKKNKPLKEISKEINFSSKAYKSFKPKISI